MALTDDQLLDLLERAAKEEDPALDIEKHASLTRDDAYRLQLAYKRRLAEAGDPHLGYRISMSSRNGILESVALGLLPEEAANTISPVFSSLSASNIGSQDEVVTVRPGNFAYIEAEVGILIGERLQGPGVTPTSALRAVAGFLPGIDLPQISKNHQYGLLHILSTMATPLDTTVIFGSKLTPPTIDLPLEGIVVSVNGQPRASSTAWECMGSPMNALSWLANELAKHGAALEPGQLVITGVCPYPQRLAPGDTSARADFTNLGSVSVRVSV